MVTRNPKCRAGTEEDRKAANSIYSKRITKWKLAQDIEVSGDLTKKYLGIREVFTHSGRYKEGYSSLILLSSFTTVFNLFL